MLRKAAPAGFEPPKSPTQLDVSWVTSTGTVARNLGRLGSRQRQRRPMLARTPPYRQWVKECLPVEGLPPTLSLTSACLLYTSDAADDLLCVDLGGRRIIKKKK